MTGQRNFVQFLKQRSRTIKGWTSSHSRGRAVTFLVASISPDSYVDGSWSGCIMGNSSVKEPFLLRRHRGATVSLPTPFGSFHRRFLPSPVPHSEFAHTEALRTDQLLTSREQCLLEIAMTSPTGMWLRVLNGRFALEHVWPDLVFLFAWFLLKQMVFLPLFPIEPLRQVLIDLAPGRGTRLI